ncbi:hypothetical protein K438DRAFT_1772720 [Mycena galopus ATCC 62051]|nr:hypothetical protein K438DRAFT_1772720 [Mycena galopus ATCC 62051]
MPNKSKELRQFKQDLINAKKSKPTTVKGKIYRYVPQGYAAIEPINPEGGVAAIGTYGLTPCVGVYFRLGDDKCFVAHFDAQTSADTEKAAQALATDVCGKLRKRIEDLFHEINVNLASAADLKLTVNAGDKTSVALGWAVQRNFDTKFSPTEKDSAAPKTMAEMEAAIKSERGFGFAVEGDAIIRWTITETTPMEPEPFAAGVERRYGRAGFTF